MKTIDVWTLSVAVTAAAALTGCSTLPFTAEPADSSAATYSAAGGHDAPSQEQDPPTMPSGDPHSGAAGHGHFYR